MPQGFEGVREASADIASRRQSSSFDSDVLWFKLKGDKDTATVRFVGTIAYAWGHEVAPKGKQRWGDFVPCRDQDDAGRRNGQSCPGCLQGLDRSFQGWVNLIWRDAPIFQRDERGWIVKDGNNNYVITGRQDQMATWQGGITLFEILDEKAVQFKGLDSRDFKVTRNGLGLDTRYSIEPVVDNDGNANAAPPSDADLELAKGAKDLNGFVIIPALEEWNNGGGQQQAQDTNVFDNADASPFMATKE